MSSLAHPFNFSLLVFDQRNKIIPYKIKINQTHFLAYILLESYSQLKRDMLFLSIFNVVMVAWHFYAAFLMLIFSCYVLRIYFIEFIRLTLQRIVVSEAAVQCIYYLNMHQTTACLDGRINSLILSVNFSFLLYN